MKNYSDFSDRELVEMTLVGDTDAFGELVTRHGPAVLNAARVVTRNPYAAEDAAQDAFLAGWMRLSSLRDREKFRAWIVSVAKNAACNLLARYENAVPAISLDVAAFETGEEDPDLLALADDGEIRELHEAVDALSEKLRETVRLHYFEGYSVKEIAAMLSVPEGTAKRRLSEGRKQLRKGYGIMEKTYDESETLVSRVMRQVEELKLWQLRHDKEGFEEEYRSVLAAVESLPESEKKRHMLADVWLRGAWWLPGEENEELYVKIKAAALAGHNEDVMQAVMLREIRSAPISEKGEEQGVWVHPRQEKLRDVLIPEMEAAGFPKTVAYLRFWLGKDLRDFSREEEARAEFEKVKSLLSPDETYYAAAVAALEGEAKFADAGVCREYDWGKSARLWVSGEKYRKIGGRWVFWEGPGYEASPGVITDGDGYGIAPVLWKKFSWNRDYVMLDPNELPGEYDAVGNCVLTIRDEEAPVVTPAGRFEHCRTYDVEGRDWKGYRVTTTVCPGVGIVKQFSLADQRTLTLRDYALSPLPDGGIFAAGNRWEYDWAVENMGTWGTAKLEIVSSSEDSVTAAFTAVLRPEADTGSWYGNLLAAQIRYKKRGENGKLILADVEPYLKKAEELAVTPRQKLETEISNRVMRRIFARSPDVNPNTETIGRHDVFNVRPVPPREDGVLRLGIREDGISLEREHRILFIRQRLAWETEFSAVQEAVNGGDLWGMLEAAGDGLWRDEWIPGFRADLDYMLWLSVPVQSTVEIGEDEDVETPAGRFEACRHFTADAKNEIITRWAGHIEAWFAPGVGPVKILHRTERIDSVWELTEVRGTGEGYFPLETGFFRRYEAKDLPDGYRASVEYTLLADRDGVSGKENREEPVLLMFTDISADQRREHAEKKG